MEFRKRKFLYLFLAVIPFVKSFAQEPRLVLPVGHSSPVIAAAYSPDGAYIATGSWDNTAKIWLSSEGRLLHDLKGHSNSLTAVTFSRNGKLLATCSKDSTVRIWEVESGKLVVKLEGHRDWVSSAVFSSDASQLISASWDNRVLVWDIVKGTIIREFSGHTAPVQMVALSPDGKTLASVSDDHTGIIYDLSSGIQKYVLKGHASEIRTVQFSPDGTSCLTASADNTAKLWSLFTGKQIRDFVGHKGSVQTAVFSRNGRFVLTASMDHSAIVWNLADGKIKHILKGHEAPVQSAAYDRTGRFVITASRDQTLRIWDGVTGKNIHNVTAHSDWVNLAITHPQRNEILSISSDNTAKTWDIQGRLKYNLQGYLTRIQSAAFSHDGQYLLTGSWDSTAKLWRHNDGQLLFEFKGHRDWVNAAVFSPSGKFIATASSDRTAGIWNTTDGSLQFMLSGHTDLVNTVKFSPDERFLLTTSWDNTAAVWSVESGNRICSLEGHDSVIQSADISPDSRYIVTGSWDNKAIVWDAITGKDIRKLEGHTDKIRQVAFSPDGEKILTASWDNHAIIWRTGDGQLLFRLNNHHSLIHSAGFNNDGTLVATGSMDNTAIIWNVSDGKPLHHLRGHSKSIYQVTFSPDGKTLATASWDNRVNIWEVSGGHLLSTLEEHTEPVTAAVFHPEGKQMVTVSEDNTLRKWQVPEGDLLYTLYVAKGRDYLILDKAGRYDGTPGARGLLYYVCGNEVVDLEQFKALGWEPGLAGKLSGHNTEPITAKKLSEINICNQTPRVIDKGILNGSYYFDVLPGRGGIGEVELYVNQKLIRKYKPADLVKKNSFYTLTVPQSLIRSYFISGESNYVTVRAATRAGTMLSRGTTLAPVQPSKAKVNPDLHILSIGVSKYKGEQLKLTYASKDATDFNAIMDLAGKKLFNTDAKPHVFTYLFNTEGKGGRWPSKTSISKLADSLANRLKPDDILLVFFAGHGVLTSGPNSFYLLTADAGSQDLSGVENEVAISTDELLGWLRRIRANKQVLILDACNSGQVVQQAGAIRIKREMPADQLRALENLKDKTGTFILSASASGQAAYETSLFGQGILTYSLLSGIKLGSGLQDNRYIDLSNWFNYAAGQVKNLAREIGGRQDPQIIGNASFAIGMVDKAISESINLPMKKKIFRNSLFIHNDELLSDDLDLSVLIDQALKNEAERGRQSAWVYVAGNNFAEAHSVRGRYEIKGDTVQVKVSVIKGVREVLFSFETSGTLRNKDALAEQIVNRIRLSLPQ